MIFICALLEVMGDLRLRKSVEDSIMTVCTTFTDFFSFVQQYKLINALLSGHVHQSLADGHKASKRAGKTDLSSLPCNYDNYASLLSEFNRKVITTGEKDAAHNSRVSRH